QNAREHLDFRYQALTVAFESLELNITRLEEDMALLQTRQRVASEEVKHEVEQALHATDNFMALQKKALQQAVGHVFERHNILALAGIDPLNHRHDEPDALTQLVLDDEGQAQIALSKIRSSCEQVMLDAQTKISRELALRFDQLESTLARSLNEAMRPIELRIKEQLSHAGFRARISFPAFQANQLNFNTRALFNDAIAQDNRPAGQPSTTGSVRETVSRWLNNPGWGWEEYVATRTRYVIDIAQLNDKFTQHIDLFCEQIRKALTAQVDVSVTAGMATFFAEFSLCLAGLQESLRDSLAVRQQNEHSTRALSQLLKESITTATWIQEDTRLLRDDIQTLFAAEQP
ncbi:clamp-binding protein CrfC, partial [Enterobacter cloacae]|nr:clamp-binding protein CrfC [Enterobacter cloacae]